MASSQKPAMSAILGSDGEDKTPASPTGPKRPPRIPMNVGMNLYIPEKLLDRTKFAYRWFAESSIKGGRIETAKGAYWEHVADSRGHNAKRPSATDTMYFMQLELKYWQEDQAAKRRKVQLTMQKETGIGEGEYAPDGGTSSVTRTAPQALG